MIKHFIRYISSLLLCLFLLIALSACLYDAKNYSQDGSLNKNDAVLSFETDPPYIFDDPEDEYSKETCKETERKTTKYVLNIRSKKMHKTTCGTGDLILPENREIYVGYIEDLYEKGYTECGNCFK